MPIEIRCRDDICGIVHQELGTPFFRHTTLIYKTTEGARIGDLYMSLIHTAELNGANPFEYLVALECCSLTFKAGDATMKNLIATSMTRVPAQLWLVLPLLGLPRPRFYPPSV